MRIRSLRFPYASLVTPALAASLALSGCGGERTAADSASESAAALLASTDVAQSSRTDLVAGLPVSGTLTPATDVLIGAPLAEVIEAVPVREGQAVQKDELLARFRDQALGPAAAGAEAELKAAAAEYERNENLFKAGAISKRDVETAEARWKSAQAAAAQAAKMYSDASVRTPIDGVIAKKYVEAGNRPGIGDPMFRVVNTSRLEFEATVPSEFVRLVHPGAAVRLDISGFPTGTIAGRVARVNATADPATRQVEVYVSVPNPKGALVGGLYAQGVIVTGAARAALAVPDAALKTQGDSTFVYVVESGRLARHAVRTGVRDADRGLTEILSGLDAGDTVITGAVEGLTPGQPIKIGGKES
ncbi:MAG TPA: efflux RND transporter periplasmic adaptor subunit [Dongiaceae bacterium]|nr:efflux RND transporter periplasmic adaptor subunit [Dongiaceae bacterium]